MALKLTAALLILFNVFIFGITFYFSRNVNNKSSKIGFAFMELLAIANSIMIGGLVWAL